MEHLRGEVGTTVDEGVAAIVLFWGDPAPYVVVAHGKGVKVLIQVGSVEEAKAAAEAGVDAVIAQGVEAGGYVNGTTPIWELIPATVAAIDPVPVLASGGVGDGTGLARALNLGAQGVSLGTCFVASEEAWLHPEYKRRIVEATAEDTVLNELYNLWWPGAPHRTLRNKTLEEWEPAANRPVSVRAKGPQSERSSRQLAKRSNGLAMQELELRSPTSTATSTTRPYGQARR
jgi:NAD(P)H-dependent flavin oxidoreductase YrpB (nitropropane dioxygenase family)